MMRKLGFVFTRIGIDLRHTGRVPGTPYATLSAPRIGSPEGSPRRGSLSCRHPTKRPPSSGTNGGCVDTMIPASFPKARRTGTPRHTPRLQLRRLLMGARFLSNHLSKRVVFLITVGVLVVLSSWPHPLVIGGERVATTYGFPFPFLTVVSCPGVLFIGPHHECMFTNYLGVGPCWHYAGLAVDLLINAMVLFLTLIVCELLRRRFSPTRNQGASPQPSSGDTMRNSIVLPKN
jgi:hypothetical protein